MKEYILIAEITDCQEHNVTEITELVIQTKVIEKISEEKKFCKLSYDNLDERMKKIIQDLNTTQFSEIQIRDYDGRKRWIYAVGSPADIFKQIYS